MTSPTHWRSSSRPRVSVRRAERPRRRSPGANDDIGSRPSAPNRSVSSRSLMAAMWALATSPDVRWNSGSPLVRARSRARGRRDQGPSDRSARCQSAGRGRRGFSGRGSVAVMFAIDPSARRDVDPEGGPQTRPGAGHGELPAVGQRLEAFPLQIAADELGKRAFVIHDHRPVSARLFWPVTGIGCRLAHAPIVGDPPPALRRESPSRHRTFANLTERLARAHRPAVSLPSTGWVWSVGRSGAVAGCCSPRTPS